MKLEEALPIAEMVRATLAPHCEPGRCVIAGSIRRRKAEVGDIEIVCIPQQTTTDLFGGHEMACPQFCRAVDQWPKLKGSATGRYTQRWVMEPRQIKLDLFMTRPHAWGMILSIRTGPAEFSAGLASAANARGYRMFGGELWRSGRLVNVWDEEDLFRKLDVKWKEPEERT
jgi:DNA polymerase/3'-5' exonuclease PolX